jgi:pimeloyl-ACP methyl ester carboxylesterase/DNA-binding SARP family transcriptional activator
MTPLGHVGSCDPRATTARTRFCTRSTDNWLVLCFLGPAAVLTNGLLRPLELRPKVLALLVRLALGGGAQDRDVLADLLFPDAANPRESLRWHLSQLRAQLPLRIEADRRSIALTAQTDVARFRLGAERILRYGLEDAATILALYRGDLCTGLRVTASADFHNWLYVQEDELRRIFRRATVANARAALAERRPDEVIASVRRLTQVDPYLEDGHVLLVEALDAAGQKDEARHAYDRYQRIVRSELHAQPREELARRYESGAPTGHGLPLDELVALGTITMHVVDWSGEPPPVVGIHGSAGHAYGLTALGERLAPDVRFVAVDLRGHGFSDKPPSNYGIQEHVGDLLQMIDALALEKPILLGHSIGGAIATFAAQAAGDRIGGLVLFDAVVGDRRFVEKASFVVEDFGASLEHRFADFDEYQAQWGIQPDDSAWQRWLERSKRMELVPLPDGTLRRRSLRDALAMEWTSVARADALAALADVTVPVLVVYADAPWYTVPYLDEATVQAQLTAARNSRMYVAHGQNHSEILRRPNDGLIRALKAFVVDVKAAATLSASWRR